METKELKKKSIVSTASLFFQSGYSAVLGFIANVILTIYLSPEIFGIYITVLSIIVLLNYFSDIGMAASLIQRKEVTDDDLKTAFTIQQILILSLVSLGFIMTQPIMNFYGLYAGGKELYWALLLGFFLSSLKTIPSVLLERSINFHKIVMVQIIENTVFYITVAILAIQGYGLFSFTVGVLLRSVIGLVVIYRLSFWLPRIGISEKSLKHLLSYGVPFQSMSFLAIFKDELVNLFLGKVIGFEALGLIGWAKKWAESSLRVIMDNVSKVVFPLFSRVQRDPDRQTKVLNRVIRYQSMIILPALVGMALVMPVIVDILPKYEKWRPALPIFYIFIVSSLFNSYLGPFINFFSAIGKIKVSLTFMIFWTLLTWALIIPLSNIFGIYGFPLTILTISLTSIFVALKAKTIVPYNFIASTYRYFISGIIMSASVLLTAYLTHNFGLLRLLSMVLVGVLSYYGSLVLIFRENIAKDVLQEYRS